MQVQLKLLFPKNWCTYLYVCRYGIAQCLQQLSSHSYTSSSVRPGTYIPATFNRYKMQVRRIKRRKKKLFGPSRHYGQIYAELGINRQQIVQIHCSITRYLLIYFNTYACIEIQVVLGGLSNYSLSRWDENYNR